MQSTAGIADRVFRALQTTNVMMISQGASEINMSLVLNEEDIERAVKNLHGEFFPLSQGGEIFESLHHEAGT
jgi:aspartate kinase